MPRALDLVLAIRERMPNVPAQIKGAGLKSYWPLAPLETHEVLGEIPLREFTQVTVKKTLPELYEVFEKFVAEYLAPNCPEKPLLRRAFLCKALDLNSKLACWLFPDHETHTTQHHLAVLMWLIRNTHPNVTVEAGPGTCLVTHGSTVFGVRDGLLVSRFHHDHPAGDRYFNYLKAIQENHVGKGRTISDNGLSSFMRHTHTIEDGTEREKVRLALRILYYRFGHMGRLTNLLYNGKERRPRGLGLRTVCTNLQRTLMDHSNPMPVIYEELVTSGRVSESDFCDYFRDDAELRHEDPENYFVSGPTLAIWHRTLAKIGGKKK